MAFQGMNPDDAREVAQEITNSGQEVLEAINRVTERVNSVEWVGPDYDSFRDDWNQFVNNGVANLVEGFEEKGKFLVAQADEQDTGSSAR